LINYLSRKSPPHLIAILYIALLLLALGCTRDLPVSPSTVATPEKTDSFSNRSILGMWSVSIDPSTLSFDISPSRASSAHWNVTGYIQPPTCPGCITFSNQHISKPGIVSVEVGLTHPFDGTPSLDAFDVRGIVYGPPVLTFPSGTVSQLLDNPDGYCARWSHDPWARINPFMAFALDSPDRRFESGSTHQREFLIKLPVTGKLNFDFAIDACWLPPKMVDPDIPSLSPHANEAVDVSCMISGPINAHPNSFSLLEIKFTDWQNDGAKANLTIEVPAIAPNPIPATYIYDSGDPTFTARVSNVLNSPSGVYPALICARDTLNNPSNDALTTFTLSNIAISSDLPAAVSLTVWPASASLDNQNSLSQFEAIEQFVDGGYAPIPSGVKWSCDGSDLNGSPLIQIDSQGLAKRLTSKWWGGTATIHASYDGFDADALAICPDPFADSATVDFGTFCTEGGSFTKVKSLLGPPVGGGLLGGGTDVCALGYGGVATLEFTNNVIVDRPGPDFIVFENAFYSGGCDWMSIWQDGSWCETAIVEASQDGIHWFRFPPDYDPSNTTCGIDPWANPRSFNNLAGVHPVLASVAPDSTLSDGIDPTDPSSAGGDSFDLSEIGLDWCKFVRLIDTGDSIDAPGTEQHDSDGDLILDFGKMSPLGAQPGQAGFDCDSVAAIHSESPLELKK
jgi:hypothetical protein